MAADLTEPQWVDMFRDIPGPELVRSRGCWRQKESVTQVIKEVDPREQRVQDLHFEKVLRNGHMAPQLVKPQWISSICQYCPEGLAETLPKEVILQNSPASTPDFETPLISKPKTMTFCGTF